MQKSILTVKTLDESLKSCMNPKSKQRSKFMRQSTATTASTVSLDLSLSLDISEPTLPTPNTVKFGTIFIREYSRTVGDNPACSRGVPLSLGWSYNKDHQELPLDFFEEHRHGKRRDVCGMKIPPDVREQILKNEWEVPMREIYKAHAESKKIQQQRNNSVRITSRMMELRRVMTLSLCRPKR